MQAIRTKYHGPTDRHSSRISASADAGRVYVSYTGEINIGGNHQRAALALMDKLGWEGKLATGELPDGSYAHVFV